MLPSMFSGVSGLLTHQQRMNVIGNDIANVNTVGYKQSDVTFKESFVNTLRAPVPGTPGQQIGLGVQMGHITRDFTGGALMQTGVSSNIAISGNGFFAVQDPGDGDRTYYTRAGDFVLDVSEVGGDDGVFLITSEGRRLLGEDGDPINLLDGPGVPPDPQVVSFSIGLDGMIRVTYLGEADPVEIGRVGVATFDNPNGLQAIGSNLFLHTAAAGEENFGLAGGVVPGEGGVGQVFQGFLENSNVDLAREFTDMIITQRGFQANSRSISTSDEMLAELLTLKR